MEYKNKQYFKGLSIGNKYLVPSSCQMGAGLVFSLLERCVVALQWGRAEEDELVRVCQGSEYIDEVDRMSFIDHVLPAVMHGDKHELRSGPGIMCWILPPSAAYTTLDSFKFDHFGRQPIG
jgi:hypothetical protein